MFLIGHFALMIDGRRPTGRVVDITVACLVIVLQEKWYYLETTSILHSYLIQSLFTFYYWICETINDKLVSIQMKMILQDWDMKSCSSCILEPSVSVPALGALAWRQEKWPLAFHCAGRKSWIECHCLAIDLFVET